MDPFRLFAEGGMNKIMEGKIMEERIRHDKFVPPQLARIVVVESFEVHFSMILSQMILFLPSSPRIMP